MNKIYNFFSSVKLAVILLLVYAIVIAIATFVENDFSTQSANWLVYKSLWFNVLNLLLLLNMSAVFVKFKMYQLKKLPVFLFHLGLVIIVIGAGLTRFLSYEGVMHIREGESSNTITTYDTYLNIKIDNSDLQYEYALPANFNELSRNLFSEDIDFEAQSIHVEVEDFVPNAAETIVKSNDGGYIIAFAVSGKSAREDVYIKEGEEKIFDEQVYNFKGDIIDNAINFLNTDSGLIILNSKSTLVANMTDTLANNYTSLQPIPVAKLKLYKWSIYSMVISDIYEKSISVIEQQENKKQFPLSALKLSVFDGQDQKTIFLFGESGYIGRTTKFTMNGLNYQLSYGSKSIELPFSLILDDFKMKRYSGSDSPESYESFITLTDSRNHTTEQHHIYMNNVLSYDGIRFYQSSYDPDEQGTILSVNKDYLGTIVTYLGYFLLMLGMFLNVFHKESRFRKLNHKVKMLSSKSTMGLLLLLSFAFFGLDTQAQEIPQIDKQHAEHFGKLLVQNKDGRIKPVNTLATEVLLKISRKSTYKNLNAEQVLLSMILSPQAWSKEPIIKVKNPDIIKKFNVKDKHIAIADVFDNQAQYILYKDVSEAYSKPPGRQTKYDKSIIKLDEKINILYMILNGDLLNIFPLRNALNNKWYSIKEAGKVFPKDDSVFVFNVYKLYMLDLLNAMETDNWLKADSSLNYIKIYQQKAGADVVISDSKRDAEIFYNKSAIFRHLFEFYFIIGIAFLILLFVKLLYDSINVKYLIYAFVSLIVIAFGVQTFGLGLRWYISGHAPWSNGYESMIYISWATMLSGMAFAKKSKISLAATTVLSGMILLVAHLSWIDPEITNLVPVLQSYWLTIHVAVITASYGFLALGALLGFINLLLMGFKTKENKDRLDIKILQLTYINEMTLIVGLFLLSIGTFLGGVWANESWGRYWGWDSKETWALITMLVYALILHMRFIPKLKNLFIFNLFSLLSYATVIMTYFGVNYYLSGLHSYAKGDPVPIPMSVYYTLTVVFLVAVFANNRNRRWE